MIAEIISIGVPVISDQRTGYFRISSHPSGTVRKAPHNLYADTNLLKTIVQKASLWVPRPSSNIRIKWCTGIFEYFAFALVFLNVVRQIIVIAIWAHSGIPAAVVLA